MNPWAYIIIGGVLILAGTIAGGYGWHILSKDQSKVEKLIKESSQDIKSALDHKIYSFNEQLNVLTNIKDPRMQDGGKVAAMVKWKDGPIIDIVNPKDISKNRLQVAIKYQGQIFLHLYDSNGKHYVLESEYNKIDQSTLLECLWSSKQNIIAILVDKKILTRIQIPDLRVFHDTSIDREIRIGSNVEGEHGFGNIKNLMIFTAKDL
jgi:hypothetical protein